MRARNMMAGGLGAGTALAVSGGSDMDLAVTATGSTSQANSYGIKSPITQVTTAVSGSGVRLPADANNGDEFIISNEGANALLLYPPTGGTLNATAANGSISVASGAVALCKATSPTHFIVLKA